MKDAVLLYRYSRLTWDWVKLCVCYAPFNYFLSLFTFWSNKSQTHTHRLQLQWLQPLIFSGNKEQSEQMLPLNTFISGDDYCWKHHPAPRVIIDHTNQTNSPSAFLKVSNKQPVQTPSPFLHCRTREWSSQEYLLLAKSWCQMLRCFRHTDAWGKARPPN